MKRIFLFTFSLSFLFCQDISFGGFIKFDSFYNSRQIVSAREGHFYLYPKNRILNSLNKDRHADPFLNMTMFQSRAWLKIKGGSAWQANLSGSVEVDFFGTTNGLENIVRLRHAFIKLAWPKTSLLVGQYWSPFFTVDVFPQCVNFNTGVPFQPFARFPQISIYHSVTQQRSGLPAIHLHSIYEKGPVLFGIGWMQKTLRPLFDNIQAEAMTVYGKWDMNRFTFRAKVISGNDLADHIMLGGCVNIKNTVTGLITCNPTQLMSYWFDVDYTIRNYSIGIFGGYSSNLGIDRPLTPIEQFSFSARSPDIQNVRRVSPRFTVKSGAVKFAFEYDLTIAKYAAEWNAYLIPMNSSPVQNHRFLLAMYLVF